MGQVICPDGTSVQSDKVTGSVPFEYLVRDMRSECCTDEYRSKCIKAIGDVGLFSQAKEIGYFLHRLMAETESDQLREACQYVLSKHKIKKKKEKTEINEFLTKCGLHC